MTQRHQTPWGTALVLTLAAALLAGTAWAQFGGGTPMPSSGFGDTSSMPPPTGGRDTNREMRMQHSPFAAGTVRTIDAATGAITLTPLFPQGQAQTIIVTAATKITAQTQGKVSNLKVGEAIQVRGVPTGITVSQIADNDSSENLPRGGASGLERVSGFGQQPGGGHLPWAGGTPAIAQATGKITSLSPLTLSVSPDVQIVLKAAPDLQVTRTLTEKISDLKVGDRIMATGQPTAEGNLNADQIRVNGYGPR